MTAAEHRTAAVKLLKDQVGQYRLGDFFSDWCEAVALSFANAHPLGRTQEREERYLQLAERHGEATMAVFPQVLAHVTMAFDVELADHLGSLYHELELAAGELGQFFTPYDVSKFMAGMSIDDQAVKEQVEKRGYLTLHEPACGAGGMVIAFADSMRAAGLNYQTQLHVQAWDVERTAAHMALIQLSLLHIPAEIVLGNTLTLEVYEVFHTPAHHLGFWRHRLRRRESAELEAAA